MRQSKSSLPQVVSVMNFDYTDTKVTSITGTRSGVVSVTLLDSVVIRPL